MSYHKFCKQSYAVCNVQVVRVDTCSSDARMLRRIRNTRMVARRGALCARARRVGFYVQNGHRNPLLCTRMAARSDERF